MAFAVFRFLFLCVLLFTGLPLPRSASAEPIRFPRPIRELAAQSTVVVVAKVITAQKDVAGERLYPNRVRVAPPPTQIQGQVIACLKGRVTETFTASVQRPASLAWATAPAVKVGDNALFFLQRAENGWKAVDGLTPAVRVMLDGGKLSRALVPATAPSNTTDALVRRLVPLLIPLLGEDDTHLLGAYYLSGLQDARITGALLPYINDPDLGTRDYVLVGLAANQYEGAIPRIVERARFEWNKNQRTPQCIPAIGLIRSSRAIAALNRMLLEESPYSRLNAMMTLRPLADQTSIPYLLVALHDTEPQNIVSYGAYSALFRLFHLPGKPEAWDYFVKHRNQTTARLYRGYAHRLEASGRR